MTERGSRRDPSGPKRSRSYYLDRRGIVVPTHRFSRPHVDGGRVECAFSDGYCGRRPRRGHLLRGAASDRNQCCGEGPRNGMQAHSLRSQTDHFLIPLARPYVPIISSPAMLSANSRHSVSRPAQRRRIMTAARDLGNSFCGSWGPARKAKSGGNPWRRPGPGGVAS